MPLSEIYWLNHTFLQFLQAQFKQDLPGACYRFNVDIDTARRIEALSQGELHALVSNYGSESLFQLRGDVLAKGMALPPGLQGPLAAVVSPLACTKSFSSVSRRRAA